MFPDVSIMGWHFHQKQAIRRNIQAKGILTLLKMLSELSFVLPYKVMDFFDTIITDYVDPNKETEGFIEDAEEAGDFIAYFQRTWDQHDDR